MGERLTVGSEVLVVGNGVSRLPHHRRLLKMGREMPVWCCNWAVKDFYRVMDLWHGEKRLREAVEEYRGRVRAGFKMSITEREFLCPEFFWKDSGSMLLAEAYQCEYETIHVAGFDFGGADVYSGIFPLCTAWISRWKLIGLYYRDEEFGRVDFIGCESPNRFEDGPTPGQKEKIEEMRVWWRLK